MNYKVALTFCKIHILFSYLISYSNCSSIPSKSDLSMLSYSPETSDASTLIAQSLIVHFALQKCIALTRARLRLWTLRLNRQLLFVLRLICVGCCVWPSEGRTRAYITASGSNAMHSRTEMCGCHNANAITRFAGYLCTVVAMLSFLYSLAVSLCFLSLPLSVLHTCKAECGCLRDDSSVAHLIAAWPYLGCPEILFFSLLCSVERSRQCRDNMMSSFLLSPFFYISFSE